jgi:hypothetical protein
MNAIILKGAALRQPPLPQSGPRAKTIAHPCASVFHSSFCCVMCVLRVHNNTNSEEGN